MKAEIVRIGNSHGVRIPKPVLEQCGLTGQVEMEVKDGALVIAPVSKPRKGWAEAFKKMSSSGDDEMLLPDEAISDWDDREWQW